MKLKLTVRAVEAAKPGRHSDGGGDGLILQVDASGSRRWLQRLTVNGRRTDLGLGAYPRVSLAEAREAARANAKIARQGGDPRALRRAQAAIPTFEVAARTIHKDHRPTWRSERHAHDFIASLETHVFPKLGRMRIDHVGPADVLAVLKPIWTRIPPTAQRVHQRIGLVMRTAVAQGWRTDDPAAAIVEALAKPDRRQTPRRALPYAQAGEALRAIRAADCQPSIGRALEFIALTAVRSNEARGARWGEVDFGSALWTVPGERMKAGEEHRVPLSPPALALLREARTERWGDAEPDPGALVFPGARHGRPVNDSTLSALMRKLGIAGCVHGFRSSFRQWAQELTDYPREVAELALAHRVGNAVERAYARSDLLDRRRGLMNDWAAYVLREPVRLTVVA